MLGLGDLKSHSVLSFAPVLTVALATAFAPSLAAAFILSSSQEPTIVSEIKKDVKHISAGYTHPCAVTVDGKLYMWGKNSDGQLGLGKMNILRGSSKNLKGSRSKRFLQKMAMYLYSVKEQSTSLKQRSCIDAQK